MHFSTVFFTKPNLIKKIKNARDLQFRSFLISKRPNNQRFWTLFFYKKIRPFWKVTELTSLPGVSMLSVTEHRLVSVQWTPYMMSVFGWSTGWVSDSGPGPGFPTEQIKLWRYSILFLLFNTKEYQHYWPSWFGGIALGSADFLCPTLCVKIAVQSWLLIGCCIYGGQTR